MSFSRLEPVADSRAPVRFRSTAFDLGIANLYACRGAIDRDPWTEIGMHKANKTKFGGALLFEIFRVVAD